MSINGLEFTKDWTNPVDFPTYEDNETQVRADIQCLYDEIKNYINRTLLPGLTTNGAENTLLSSGQSVEAAINDRYTKLETNTKVSSETNDLIKDWSINLDTGVITVTKKDGTTESYDTALEKIPATFELVTEGSSVYLKITNVDGSSTKTDVTSLLNVYNFTATDTVAFTVTGDGSTKTVSAKVRDNSITLDMLALDALTQIQQWVTQTAANASAAATSETNAKTSETNAKKSESNASASASSAQTYAESAKASQATATTKATQASASATEAQSWAVGGTGTRAGENTNNAKYWSEQAKAIVGGDFVTAEEAQGYANTAETNAKAYTDEKTPFIVTLDPNTNTSDKTYDEITVALAAGKQVLLHSTASGFYLPYTMTVSGDTSYHLFSRTAGENRGALMLDLVGVLSNNTVVEDTTPLAVLEGITNDRAAYINSKGHLASSAVTSTELGYLSGVTSNVQTQLDSKKGSSHIWYATCNTAKATADKVANTTEDGFELKTGASVLVRFSYGLSDVASTLNVNGTGAKPIRRMGSGSTSKYLGGLQESVLLMYDAVDSCWYVVNFAVATETSLGAVILSSSIATSSNTTVPTTNAVAEALATKAPAYTYGTTDLTAGVSELATGTLYFVYEE